MGGGGGGGCIGTSILKEGGQELGPFVGRGGGIFGRGNIVEKRGVRVTFLYTACLGGNMRPENGTE